MIPSIRMIGMFCLAVAALVFCTAPFAPAQHKDPYTLAVIPSAPPVATYALWAPFVDRLSHDTGILLRLKVYDKMSDFEQDIVQGIPDFLFVSPFQAVVAHEAQAYAPLVRGSRPVSAELFVRKDSPIMTVDDLSNKRIAFVGDKNL